MWAGRNPIGGDMVDSDRMREIMEGIILKTIPPIVDTPEEADFRKRIEKSVQERNRCHGGKCKESWVPVFHLVIIFSETIANICRYGCM
ncbi:MAG: hypothetical protein CMI55_04440 [Parcubacteria group bacterium]|nr:hypothetical protein [Parcubacteria group bacterium]